MLCPSDNAAGDTQITNATIGAYIASRQWRTGGSYGITLNRGLPSIGIDTATMARTNYCGVAGYLGRQNNLAFDQYEGIFTCRSEHRPNDILDGLSNTLMFGEGVWGYLPGAKDRSRSATWMGMGTHVTSFGLTNTGEWTRFTSLHPGATQFALADGSVRAMRNINPGVNPPFPPPISIMDRLGGMRDGMIQSVAER